MHMDEESYFDTENGHKIVDYCDNENYLIRFEGQKPSLANGCVIYTKQDVPDNWLLTMVDTSRIGFDRFILSWSYTYYKKSVLGTKGSCWMIHSELERSVGFDVRYKRSIGEDWAASLDFNQRG